MKRTFILFPFLVLLTFLAHSQPSNLKIKQSFEKFLALDDMRHGIAAIHVADSETGELIYQHNSHVGLPTASTLKVITAISAFEFLGADYRYQTQLGYSGVIDQSGILHGDILIVGSGDPTLGSHRYDETKSELLLQQWVEAIRGKGIRAIQGRIIADDRLYGGITLPNGWPWIDMGNYYGAGISALNWKENKAGVTFEPSAIGQPAAVTNITSDLAHLSVINDVTTGNPGTGDNVYAYSAPYSTKIYLRGTYGQDLKKTIEISLPDPAYQLAYDMQHALTEASIVVGGEPTTGQILSEQGLAVSEIGTPILTHQSPQLSDIAYWFNRMSINLYGEALLRSIAQTDNKMTTPQGAAMVKDYWSDKLHISKGELDIVDGSGLSPQNNVTTHAMNKIMRYAIGKPWSADFAKGLPTINRMTMKSGTISGTLGYTGYHTSETGQKYTFSFLVYNYNGSAGAMRRHMFTMLDSLR